MTNGLRATTRLGGHVQPLRAAFPVGAAGQGHRVDDDDDLSRLAGLLMVNGGFQYDCLQGLLTKGIKSMFEGELWFPRKVLQQYLVKSRAFNKTFGRNEVNLTDREIEVLKVMATGAKNSEIATVLNLSPHTIKTHIYNIFKKINASNRLQAVNWAQENL